MKWKLVSAFATGAVLASGIVYFAVRPLATVVEEPQHVASVSRPAPVQQILPAAPASKPAAPIATHKRPTVPVSEKPSPFHPRGLREEPVAVAKSAPPQQVAAPPVAAAPPVQNVSLPHVSLPPPKPEPEVIEPKTTPSVTLNAGTLLPIRIGQELSPARNQAGDSFSATLARPLVVDGWVIAESGARVEGHVEQKSIQSLRISMVRVSTSDGQNVRIHAEPYLKAPLAEIPVGAQITFQVLDPVTITERLN